MIEAIIKKMKMQPESIRIEEVEKVLTAYGYVFYGQQGNHRLYWNEEKGVYITIKCDEPLKKAYVFYVLNRIEW